MRPFIFLALCFSVLLISACSAQRDAADVPVEGSESSDSHAEHGGQQSPNHTHSEFEHRPSSHDSPHATDVTHDDTSHADRNNHPARHNHAHDHSTAKHDDKHAHGDHDGNHATNELSSLSAAEIFDRRILPILRSKEASSCTECHFGGVELQNYIHEDQATTFAALRSENLINVESPDKSKLLTFIGRRPDKEDPLLAQVRRNEYQVFRAWIHAAVRNPDLLVAKTADTTIGTELPIEVVRHMRRDRVLQSFVENIWVEMGRCVNCHSPERNQRQVREHGEQVSWIVPRDPAATLEKLVEGGNIDTDNPDESLVFLKPVGLEDHGGGPKFAAGSRTDKNYRRFLNDYAAVVIGVYERIDQLPEESKYVAVPPGQHLRIVGLPEELGRKLLKVELFRQTDEGWSETPWGIAENPVNAKRKTWQSLVFSVAPRSSKRADDLRMHAEFQLPAGRYLVRIYIDQKDSTKDDRDYELGDDEFYGEVEIDGQWEPGYQPPKIVHAPTIQ